MQKELERFCHVAPRMQFFLRHATLSEAWASTERVCWELATMPGSPVSSQVQNFAQREIGMADNDSGIGGFGWFLAGLGIGALVGVLYAPKSGKETRDDLIAGALEARDKANKYYNQGVEQAGEYYRQGKEAASQYVQQGKDFASQYVDKGKETLDRSRTQFTE